LYLIKNAQVCPRTHLILCVMSTRIHLPGFKAAVPWSRLLGCI